MSANYDGFATSSFVKLLRGSRNIGIIAPNECNHLTLFKCNSSFNYNVENVTSHNSLLCLFVTCLRLNEVFGVVLPYRFTTAVNTVTERGYSRHGVANAAKVCCETQFWVSYLKSTITQVSPFFLFFKFNDSTLFLQCISTTAASSNDQQPTQPYLCCNQAGKTEVTRPPVSA
jgi:hypothetical protein